jgi:indolepyruvate ferredoxin oxidoreductase alpha subunit
MKRLLSGNEAIAYGAYEAGCRFGVGYPGTPSTEILQNFVKYPGVYGEWAPNEKVALDVAVGMSFAVERVFVTMKHVGLNVASDSLFSAVHTGVRGGLMVVTADDPGHHSSQNEQDNRQYGKFAKLPVVEPADSAEAAAFVGTAMEISERFDTPVLFRSTTRLSHSRTVLDYPDTLEVKGGPHERVKYLREPNKQIPLPVNARRMHREIEQRLLDIAAWAETCELNRIEPGDSRLGIVASGMAYQYAREVFSEATFLKIGLAYPLPRQLFHAFAGMVDQVVVIEELDPFYEEHIRLLGIDVVGKDVFPLCGEFSVEVVRQSAIAGGLLDSPGGNGSHAARPAARAQAVGAGTTTAVAEAPASATETVDIPLPPRPPMLCPGCSHRGVFYVLQRLRAVVFGDIGCYSLGALPPLNATHTIGPMGASIGMAHGVDKVGVKDRTVAVIGDSTFFHSGMSPLVNVVTNGGVSTTIVVDNSVTAMTGHQTNPGTGRTLMGEESPPILIEDVARALGCQKVDVIDPYDLQNTRKVLTDHLDSQTPSVVVVRAPCILHTRERHPAPVVDTEICDACGQCLNIGCAPIVNRGDHVEIEALLCVGCDYCVEVCPKHAIVSRRADEEGGA